jgi:hypothetical protein
MSIPIDIRRADYVGSGALSTYGFSFAIRTKADLKVVVLDPATPPDVTLAVDTNFTVDVNAKTITLLGAYAPLPSDYKLAIILDPDLIQDADIKNADGYHLSQAEADQDRRVQQIQSLAGQAAQALQIPSSEAGSDSLTKLPSLAERKGKALVFDSATGQPKAGNLLTSSVPLLWDVIGQLSSGLVFSRYRARDSETFTRFDVNLVTAGTGGDTVVNFLKNGVIAATVTLATGIRYATATANVSLVDGDELWPEVASISPTTPPSTGVFAARS